MSEASDLKAHAVQMLRRAGWPETAGRVERGEWAPSEALREFRALKWPDASEVEARGALEALVAAERGDVERPAPTEHAHAAATIAELRAHCDALRADLATLTSERDAARTALDASLAIQSQIWDAVGGFRVGETLVDAVRRVARKEAGVNKQSDEGNLCSKFDASAQWVSRVRISEQPKREAEADGCGYCGDPGCAEVPAQRSETTEGPTARADAAALCGQVEEAAKADGLLKTELELLRAEHRETASPLRPAEDIARALADNWDKRADTAPLDADLAFRYCARSIREAFDIERSRAEGKRASVDAPRAEAQAGPHICRAHNREVFVGERDGLKGCREKGPGSWYCTIHLNGEHVALAGNEVCARWPIADAPPVEPEEAPSGMRIEKRDDGEYLIEAPKRVNDCDALHNGRRCMHHVDGDHVATDYASDPRVEKVVGRWPIASPQDEPQATVGRIVALGQNDNHMWNADGDKRIDLIVPKDVNPRAVLATVAELLGLSHPSDEQVRAAIDLGNSAYARGAEEGERRAEEKARATARGLVASWEASRVASLRLRSSVKQGTETWARRDSSALIRRSCMLALSDAFDVPLPATPDDQPPTEGEPAPSDEPCRCGPPPGMAEVIDPCPKCGRPLPADAEERWQPGAVWEHRAGFPVGVTMFTICRIGDSGRHSVFDGGRWESRADMTEANGWRYVGPASEADPVAPHIANAPTAPARTGEANPGGADAGAAGAVESVAPDSGAYERLKDELTQLEAENENLRAECERSQWAHEETLKQRIDAEFVIKMWQRATGHRTPEDFTIAARQADEEQAPKVERTPQVGDMVNLRVSKGVHPCVVLHVWGDGSVNLRDLFDLEEVESRPRDDSGAGLGTWRFRD